MKALLLLVLVLGTLVSFSAALGSVYINKIRGNDDQRSVNIELVNFQANRVKLDRIFGLNSPGGKSEGTYIEDSELVRGSFFIPKNLLVDQVATISGALHFDGGLHADALPLTGDSFTVDDDTGITTVLGVTNPNGGINVRQGKFTVEKLTGRTTIADVLRPNGDTLVNVNLFKVSAKDGAVTTKGEVDAQKDVVLGSTTNEDRYLTRVPSTSTANPGKPGFERKLTLQGQNAIAQGGDLVLEPGYAYGEHDSTSSGSLILGRGVSNDALTITRAAVTGNAGLTTLQGQAAAGRAGDLAFRSGSSADGQAPSQIKLQVGRNLDGSRSGQILLGSNSAGFDLVVRRNTLTYAADGKRTFFRAQSVSAGQNANGGKFILKAGNGFTDKRPGDVVLQPGRNGRGNEGRIKLVDLFDSATVPAWSTSNRGLDLWVTRTASLSDAGSISTSSRTTFHGQHALQGRGGSISFRAGDSATNRFDLNDINGADFYLTNGADSGPAPLPARRIYWGRSTQALSIQRPFSETTAGTSTTIRGQQAFGAGYPTGKGGDLLFISGTGVTRNGDVLLQAVDAVGKGLGQGGSVTFSTGSSIFLTAGKSSAVGAAGGDVLINAGSARNVGGNIELLAQASGTAITAIPVRAGPTQRAPTTNGALSYLDNAATTPATYTGVVAVRSASAFVLREVDFQVNQAVGAAVSSRRAVFSLRRQPASTIITHNVATGINSLNRPCDYRGIGVPDNDADCTTFTPALGDFFLQTSIPTGTVVANTASLVGGALQQITMPNYHHVFRYSSGAAGNYDTLLAPRYDGVAFGMGDSAAGNLYHLNALPRFSLLAPALWRWTLWDPSVTGTLGTGATNAPVPVAATSAPASNLGARIPPFNVNQQPNPGRLTGFTENARPVGLGGITLPFGALDANTGFLYGKSKTDKSFRGVIFDMALNLNRVICALHNIGLIQANDVAWTGNPGGGAIATNTRCDPNPVRILRYLDNTGDAFYGTKFTAPVYA